MTLLAVDNLCVGYQTRKGFIKAVEGVSFVLKRGRALGFVGESGCGKTTVGMALMRLLPDNASIRQGSIIFEGQELLAMPDAQLRQIRWKKIAMIFQAAMNALNPIHRVNDQIAEAILAHDPLATKAAAMKQVEDLFSLVDIPADRMRDYPHQYSGGMKQRAVIAMALACRPALIIADEPTTALDVIVQDQILSAVKKFQKQMNISLIFISHDIAVVADVCDDIGVMYAGQLVEYGRREEVFEAPVHPYTKALLASYLTLDGDVAQPMPFTGVTLNLIDPPPGCRFCDRCPLSDAACSLSVPEYAEITPTHKALCFRCK
ncbi:MAG: ABC transporter ATP-binding protein [Desulfobacterales bacterium]|uniref:ABC transporter ATP-binding protein n=1 Tax=Candidatus Desulfatibia vada TaxID=2841696 RepID=A0A8J6P580_9BACT|nr:ABC transporter ATP-binding protein [Candidatus Desulfatibia vada]